MHAETHPFRPADPVLLVNRRTRKRSQPWQGHARTRTQSYLRATRNMRLNSRLTKPSSLA